MKQYFYCNSADYLSNRLWYLEFYWNNLIDKRDFPSSYEDTFIKTIEGSERLLTITYNREKSVKEQYSLEELVSGLLTLPQERDFLVQETQKYLPSKYIKDHKFLFVISDCYNGTIRDIKDLLRAMKIEDPDIDVCLSDPPTRVLFSFFRSLDPYYINKCFDVPEPLTKDLKNLVKDYDRFIGGSLDSVDLVREYYQLKYCSDLEKDEVVLYQLPSLRVKCISDPSLLNSYLDKVCDPTLILDQNNYADLYRESLNEDDFSMDNFQRNYDKIKNIVFSKKIKEFSPRLVKLLTTIEFT